MSPYKYPLVRGLVPTLLNGQVALIAGLGRRREKRPGFPHLDPPGWEKMCLNFNSLHRQLSMSFHYDWAAHHPRPAVPAPLTAVEITGVLRFHYISDKCLEIAFSLITSSKLWWLLDQPLDHAT